MVCVIGQAYEEVSDLTAPIGSPSAYAKHGCLALVLCAPSVEADVETSRPRYFVDCRNEDGFNPISHARSTWDGVKTG